MGYKIKIVFLLMAFIIASCRQKESEAINSDRDGKRISYYEDGNIKSISFWKDGKVHGKVVHFYPNRQVEVEANYVNGVENGKSITYYPSGDIHKKVTYKEGKLVGDANFYSDTGKLYEQNIYDEEGNLIYVLKLNEEGVTREEMVVPVVQARKDTITSGEAFEGKVRFGYSIPGEIAIFTGVPDSTGRYLKDTLFMERLDNRTFKFSVSPYKKGYNVLPVIVVYNQASADDTLALDGSAITYPYFVK
jgi:hypothetical protein